MPLPLTLLPDPAPARGWVHLELIEGVPDDHHQVGQLVEGTCFECRLFVVSGREVSYGLGGVLEGLYVGFERVLTNLLYVII